MRVWNIGLQTQTMDASLKEHRGRVWCIKIAKDDTQAVSASADGSCIIWDLHTKLGLLFFKTDGQGRLESCASSSPPCDSSLGASSKPPEV